MGKRACYHALELRLGDLMKQVAVLKLRLGNLDGMDMLRCRSEIKKLELMEQALRNRQCALEQDKDGLWQDIRAEIQTLADELPFAVQHFFQRLDFKHSE
jgi:hypothetical protein